MYTSILQPFVNKTEYNLVFCFAGQGSGCIIYNYTIWKKDCEAEDKKVTFTCRLSNTSLRGFNYSSASISINITQRGELSWSFSLDSYCMSFRCFYFWWLITYNHWYIYWIIEGLFLILVFHSLKFPVKILQW